MLEIVDNASSPALLKVIGVGGGGSNAVNRMIQSGLRDVEFWVSNTDQQALERSQCHNRIQIGHDTTKGLGAGGDPEIGRISAEEDLSAIEAFVSGADMIFITAGMGGGTGTGAAPVIARIAREQGILTVAIVTRPFKFEGKKRLSRARRGLEALSEHVDTLITIPNQKLMEIVEPGTSFDDALLMADEVLFQATRGISDLITGHGIINLDFADVRTVMRSRGNALLGSGSAAGDNRAVDAARAAVSSPLLEDLSIAGAAALLVNIQGGPGMSFHEAAEAAQFIADQVGDEADVFWGAVVDATLEEEMRVTLVATGFPELAVSDDSSRPGAEAALGRRPAHSSSANGMQTTPMAPAAGLESPDHGPAVVNETGRGVPTESAIGETLDLGLLHGDSVSSDSNRRYETEPARATSPYPESDDDDPALTVGMEARRPQSRHRRRVDSIQVEEQPRPVGEPVLNQTEAPRTGRRLRRPPVIGSVLGRDAAPGTVSEARPVGTHRSRSPEPVSAKAIGYREPRREDRRSPEYPSQAQSQTEYRSEYRPEDRSEPARRPDRADSPRREPTSADALHGADPGLRHARWGQEESDERSGKQRSERRNPLDVPTFLRKRMED